MKRFCNLVVMTTAEAKYWTETRENDLQQIIDLLTRERDDAVRQIEARNSGKVAR